MGVVSMRECLVLLVLLVYFASILGVRGPALGDSVTEMFVNPAEISTVVGATFEVKIDICNAAGVNAWEIFLYFDPVILGLKGYSSGGFLSWFGPVSQLMFSDKSILGYVQAGQSLQPLKPEGASGNDTLIKLVFDVVGIGNSALHLSNTALYNYTLGPIVHTTTDGFLNAGSGSARTIFIRSDGSLDPDTAPIRRDGCVYTLTANFVANVNFSGIVIERDGVIFDGASHLLQGDQWVGNAIVSSGRSNVTIMNVEIRGFLVAILLEGCSGSSISYNTLEMSGHAGIMVGSSDCGSIAGNSLYGNENGIILEDSSGVAVLGNRVFACRNMGLMINSSTDSMVRENRFAASYGCAIFLAYSSNVTISCNEMVASHVGVYVHESSGNVVYHNNFISSQFGHVRIGTPNCTNTWDDGYSSGGNFWTGHNWTDFYNGPYQNVSGADGINDEPYVFDEYNVDRYPLMSEAVVDERYSIALIPLFALATLLVTIASRKRRLRRG